VEDDIPWHGVSAYADVRIDTKDIKKIILYGPTLSDEAFQGSTARVKQ
jgi:hypothetical protein